MYLLGYIPKDNRLYLGGKELNVVSYSLLLSCAGIPDRYHEEGLQYS